MPEDRIDEVLEAIHMLAENTDKRFAALEKDVIFLKENTVLKSQAVTKEYLDDKLSDMYGNSMSMDKKVDKHVDAVVETLAENKTITPQQTKKLMSMEPFPKLSV